MRFEDMNWMDVESYLKQDQRVMLVTGACEQHGYLSLTTDVRIPLALADAASQQTGVLVAPPVSFGLSPYFAAADHRFLNKLRFIKWLQPLHLYPQLLTSSGE